ncbi:hypothetical protein GCM10025876_38910 [Demequina litorisediminis]|uniref:Uncharacterized protein n=1 Tax=Demequina litorisediminis TaxID=1849022 RepID=A0ABQ6ILS2_9MICO|nr:hypothetical protein GCM10025876_38910 [Demequina litorisediminis]
MSLGETLADAEKARVADARKMLVDSDDGPSQGDGGQARPVFTHVADAVGGGNMGAEAATAITRMLRRVAERCDPDHFTPPRETSWLPRGTSA